MKFDKKTFIIACTASLFIMLPAGVLLFQNAMHTRECICEYIKNGIQQSTGCDFQTEVSACTLFPLSVTCNSAYAISDTPRITFNQTPEWYWHSKKLVFKFSWISFLFSRKLIATIEIDDLNVYSRIKNNTLAISNHLEKIFLGKFLSLPVTIKTLKVHNALLAIDAPEYQSRAQVSFSGISKKNNREFKSAWHLNKGAFFYKNNCLLEFFTGTFRSHFINRVPHEISLKANTVIHVKPDQNQIVYFNAKFDNDAWLLNAYVPDFLSDSLHVDATAQSATNIRGTAHLEKLPIQCVWKFERDTISIDLTNTHTIEIPAINCSIKPAILHSIINNNIFTFSCAVPIENKDTKQQLEKKILTKSSLDKLQFPIQQTCTYQELIAIAPPRWRTLFPGTGTIHITGIAGWPVSTCAIDLTNGAIVLGKSCNLCTDFHTALAVDFNEKTIKAKDTKAQLYYGTLSCPQALFNFDDHWHLHYIHIPVIMRNCLINWNKNVGIGSGLCTFIYTTAHSKLDAQLTLEKTYLASSIVAQLQQPQTLAHLWTQLPLDIKLRVRTKKPVHINIPGLKTKAHATLDVCGPLTQLHRSGTINLQGGTITFPSCSFTIISGVVQLDHTNTDDSLVELIAKTIIQQHTITLHVLGTLKNPVIKLSSSPMRTEQQILALLIAGSTETSLNTVLPALITQTLQQLFVTHHNQTSQPARIKFVPRLTEQTGTSGISGGIEIDFNERLKAKVQKNLDLKENLAVELDYALSDELDLKAFKDGQGQIGGQAQIKFRW